MQLTICFAGLSLFLAGCRTHPLPAVVEPVQRSQPLLGTFVTITTYGPDHDVQQRAISEAFTSIRRIDDLLSIHRPESELSRLNTFAGKGLVQVSSELYEALRQARAMSEQTDGAFDIAIGPITQLWGFIWKEHRLPSPAEILPLLPLVNPTNIILTADHRVELLKPGMLLDFGGIGKGMAVDAAIECLRANGIEKAMVKAGGDLRVIGTPPGKGFWEVQLEDPAKQGRRMTIKLRSGALSTSGSYENFFKVAEQRYSHILSPRTGLPIQGIASCTVTAPTCTASDALATAFFVIGIKDSLVHFGNRYGIRFLSDTMQVTDSDRFRCEQKNRN